MSRWRLKTVKTRPQVPWYSEEIALAKRRRPKAEKNKVACWSVSVQQMKNHATFIMNRARKEYYADFINENSTDQGRLFRATEKLLAPIDDLCFSEYNDNSLLDNDVGRFFFLKTDKIRKDHDATDIEPNELNRLLPVDPAVRTNYTASAYYAKKMSFSSYKGRLRKRAHSTPCLHRWLWTVKMSLYPSSPVWLTRLCLQVIFHLDGRMHLFYHSARNLAITTRCRI